jgi:purine-nucleoside phosphorylase
LKALAVEGPAAARGAALAIISGSGLSVVPDGIEIVDELAYERLGWPVTGVTGHPSRLLIGRWPAPEAATAGDRPTVLLACGRPHRYEGWSSAELRRPVDDLAAWGVRGLLLTNAAGGLSSELAPGGALVVDEVIDLQQAPRHDSEAPRLAATAPALAEAACAALARFLPARRGRYVAVAGPHYETPAEAAWLSARADAVGMSTVHEVRAAIDHDLELCVVSLIVNRSGASVGHAEVLAAGARLSGRLGPGLAALLLSCWPRVFGEYADPD